MASSVVPVEPTYEAIVSRAAAENFPVAPPLLPRALRGHLMSLYGFCRLADQLGDAVTGDRLGALDWLEHELDESYAGTAQHPVLQRLSPTLRQFDLPRQPFVDLIDANRMDQTVNRYGTFDDLVDYCRLSANPVGCLVLDIFHQSTPARRALSDRVCTGLQLVEHWQDVREDALAGRVYLPKEDLDRFGVPVSDLTMPSASPRLRTLLRFEVARARAWISDGRSLVSALSGWARWMTVGFVAGGLAAADAIEHADFDVLGRHARPTKAGTALRAVSLFSAGRS